MKIIEKLFENYLKIGMNYIMVEQIKLVYKPKGFDTKFFNKPEKDTAKKSTFNFTSSFKKILTNYYEKK